eukprot:297188_1
MGCIYSTYASTKTNQNKTASIPLNESHLHKMLILGRSDSGKSTTFRAIQYINNQVEDEKSLDMIKQRIREICIDIILDLIQKSSEFYEHKFMSKDDNHIDILEDYRVNICLEHASTDQLQQIYKSIEYIWNIKAIQKTYNRRFKGEYALIFSDNSAYYLNNIKRILNKKWIPTQEDCLRARLRTVGVNRCKYTVKDVQFKIFDISTHMPRSSSLNWLYCYEDLSCVIVVIGLNNYCKLVWEDERENVLTESFEMFEHICNTMYFRKTDIVLFLNKKDLFRESLRITPLTYLFDEKYKGRNFDFCDAKLKYKLVFTLLPKLLNDE